MADAKKRVLNIIPISSPTLALVAPSRHHSPDADVLQFVSPSNFPLSDLDSDESDDLAAERIARVGRPAPSLRHRDRNAIVVAAAALPPAHPSPPIAPSLDGAVLILEEGSRWPRPGTARRYRILVRE